MAAGKISIQANDGKVAGIVFEDGASSNVTVSVPKDGGTLVTQTGLSTKQDTLVSGTNIKTINSTSLLGSGDISIVSPAASQTNAGLIEIATNAEVQAGTDTVRAVTSAGMKAGLNATGTAPIYACRAWVNFNGTGTVAIRASGNVSSITDNGVGDYTINFTTAMPDANFSVLLSGKRSASSGGFNATVISSSQAKVLTYSGTAGAIEDYAEVFASIFR